MSRAAFASVVGGAIVVASISATTRVDEPIEDEPLEPRSPVGGDIRSRLSPELVADGDIRGDTVYRLRPQGGPADKSRKAALLN